ncbi:hypothetical protein GGR54DRAFT_112912 [Hypoxylon sp. NC1633]|nr:hypothetical protein GGR54DRAFT_112912 [Hypoxylon sp. NC1633]
MAGSSGDKVDADHHNHGRPIYVQLSRHGLQELQLIRTKTNGHPPQGRGLGRLLLRRRSSSVRYIRRPHTRSHHGLRGLLCLGCIGVRTGNPGRGSTSSPDWLGHACASHSKRFLTTSARPLTRGFVTPLLWSLINEFGVFEAYLEWPAATAEPLAQLLQASRLRGSQTRTSSTIASVLLATGQAMRTNGTGVGIGVEQLNGWQNL